jgi:hypothetical protein
MLNLDVKPRLGQRRSSQAECSIYTYIIYLFLEKKNENISSGIMAVSDL